MTREQIKQAAYEYSRIKSADSGLRHIIEGHFIRGAESRQPEIDQLLSDTEKYRKDLEEAAVRDRIAANIISSKRKEIEELVGALRDVLPRIVSSEERTRINSLLKKYQP